MKKQDNSGQKVLYMPVLMSIGLSIGVAIGAAAHNIPLFMCIGLSIGVGIGTVLDANRQKKDQNKSGSDEDKLD